ncbi:MAG: FAD-binding oxidoreductase [Polyangiaceae bacterium]
MTIERCGPDGGRLILRSYSRLDETCSDVRVPADAAELAQLLIEARTQSRRVTFRAGGWSLHDQSLNDDMVISLENLSRIEPVNVAEQQVTVGAAATWSDVVSATLGHDLVPYVVPSAQQITCGGSLATDGISRYSPSFGSESRHVAALELLTVGQTEPRFIPRPDPDDHDSDDARLFRAVIGGFGYLGVVTRITYDLLSVRNVGPSRARANQKVRMATELWAYESFTELIDKQMELLVEPIEEDLEHWPMPKEADPEAYPAVYSVVLPHRGNGRGAVYRSVYTRGEEGPPYIIYQPRIWFRKWMTLLLTMSSIKKLVNWAVWRSMKADARAEQRFVNDVHDYMFFMDGQVLGKRWLEDPPHRLLPLIQQTFVVHYQKAGEFLDVIPELLAAYDLEPTVFEFLFMPRDRILMSASYDMPGFAITIAFQDIESERRQAKAIAAMKELSRVVHEDFDGRIHFTKNVYAEPEVVAAMYAGRASQFLELKRQLDPEGVLRNRFLDRMLPEV